MKDRLSILEAVLYIWYLWYSPTVLQVSLSGTCGVSSFVAQGLERSLLPPF